MGFALLKPQFDDRGMTGLALQLQVFATTNTRFWKLYNYRSSLQPHHLVPPPLPSALSIIQIALEDGVHHFLSNV
jgi:hypothetical protein